MPAPLTAAVITVSDRCSAGLAEDRSGPLAVELITAAAEPGGDPAAGAPTVTLSVTPDGEDAVAQALEAALESGARLVVTTGGTGIAPRDRTPEGTRRVIDRELPGLAELVRARGLASTPMAAVTRGVVGVVDAGERCPDGAVVINLPGSTGGVRDGLEVLLPLVPHLLDQLRGGDHA